MHTRFEPDRQLTARMVLTMFLLGLLYVAFVAALIVVLKSLVLVVVIAAGLLAAQFWYSDKIALYAMRGRLVSREEQPELYGIVDRLCATADMPAPRVAVSNMDMPNAFATGRNADHAVVCVTTGLMRRLETEELEGVLAHELSHVAHRDVAVITIASFLGVLAGLIVRFALYSHLFGGRGRDQSTAAMIVIVMAVAATVYAVSFVLIRALSRYRELAADRAAAMLTGKPSALASALTKISGDVARIPTKDLRTAQAFNAFFFTPAVRPGSALSGMLSTHPSLERRLEALGEIAARLSGPGQGLGPGQGPGQEPGQGQGPGQGPGSGSGPGGG
ncbi:zinc metalloprotease HtpX [Streptomyces sp. E11-3]|uniref:zinc metalloprotease HtpX n=1 Tax=Streptomyces sp. E11-3 TaxID=3110112 RepID=UPI00397FEFA3